MAIGTLTGYAIRMKNLPTDHTYVASNQGDTWGCYGRSVGGRRICQGNGNIGKARCLSQANGHAGIKYARTGLCHQMANRILSPAGQTVTGARGARAVEHIYGVYGLDWTYMRHHHPVTYPWPELAQCDRSHTHP
jgi:hypothetical protein